MHGEPVSVQSKSPATITAIIMPIWSSELMSFEIYTFWSTISDEREVDGSYGRFNSAQRTAKTDDSVWEFDQDHQIWLPVAELALPEEKGDPIYAVAWAPNIGRYTMRNYMKSKKVPEAISP